MIDAHEWCDEAGFLDSHHLLSKEAQRFTGTAGRVELDTIIQSACRAADADPFAVTLVVPASDLRSTHRRPIPSGRPGHGGHHVAMVAVFVVNQAQANWPRRFRVGIEECHALHSRLPTGAPTARAAAGEGTVGFFRKQRPDRSTFQKIAEPVGVVPPHGALLFRVQAQPAANRATDALKSVAVHALAGNNIEVDRHRHLSSFFWVF